MNTSILNTLLIITCLVGIVLIIWKGRFLLTLLHDLFNRSELNILREKNKELLADVERSSKRETVYMAKLEMLEDAEEKLGTGAWLWDMTKDQVTFTKNFARIFDIDTNRIVDARTLMTVVHTDDRDMVNKKLKEAYENHSSYAIQYRVVRRNARNDLVEAEGIPEVTANNKVVKIKGTIQLIETDVI